MLPFYYLQEGKIKAKQVPFAKAENSWSVGELVRVWGFLSFSLPGTVSNYGLTSLSAAHAVFLTALVFCSLPGKGSQTWGPKALISVTTLSTQGWEFRREEDMPSIFVLFYSILFFLIEMACISYCPCYVARDKAWTLLLLTPPCVCSGQSLHPGFED